MFPAALSILKVAGVCTLSSTWVPSSRSRRQPLHTMYSVIYLSFYTLQHDLSTLFLQINSGRAIEFRRNQVRVHTNFLHAERYLAVNKRPVHLNKHYDNWVGTLLTSTYAETCQAYKKTRTFSHLSSQWNCNLSAGETRQLWHINQIAWFNNWSKMALLFKEVERTYST